jgi:hypothetical protein
MNLTPRSTRVAGSARALLMATSVFMSLGFCGAAVAFTGTEQHNPIQGGDSNFQTYAAFAKLESNISEAALNVFLHTVAPADMQAKIVEDYKDDLESISVYTGQLDGLKPTGEAAEALAEFKAGWSKYEKTAQGLLDKGSNVTPAELLAFYEMANDLDDVVDEALEKLQDKVGKVPTN